MKEFATLALDDLLHPHHYPCDCGMTHATQLAYLKIGSGAVTHLPQALASIQCKKPFILCDQNTKAAAWDAVRQVLDTAGIPYTLFTFLPRHIEPDEYAMGALTMHFDPSCDCICAIGSGVLNDCAKVLARATGHQSLVIATAPSMDGYASDSSSMIVDGVKSTLYNACPAAILADTDIVRMAPERMLWAGFGDMIAKYVAICEWRIAHIITGEPYCENVAQLVRLSVEKIVKNADRLLTRDPQAVEAVMEGLILSGLAMSYMKNSRPASGLEHYFSHLWEMMALERGKPYDLHGIQVGVGTCLALRVLEQVKQIQTPSRETAEAAMTAFDAAQWERNIRRVFGKTAERILEIEADVGKNSPARQAEHLRRILDHWAEIQKIMREELPVPEDLLAQMERLGMPVRYTDLNLSHEDMLDAYHYSRDIRDKYLTSSMLWDLGLLDIITPDG